MRGRALRGWRVTAAAVTSSLVLLPFGLVGVAVQVSAATTTAWHDGRFAVDVPDVVGRSDVVLGQPDSAPTQAMPLGNGDLGVGVWAANGLTAQLNRADTMPDRLSPGQVSVPGLSAMTHAADYRARLDLYDGTFVQSGGGMAATTYVSTDRDELVIDVTGADPATTQTAQLRLWQPRTPTATASGAVATLAQTWQDGTQPGAGGQTFGSLAAATADGSGVTASVVDPLTVQVSFRPHRDGTFRVVVAAPRWPQQPGGREAGDSGTGGVGAGGVGVSGVGIGDIGTGSVGTGGGGAQAFAARYLGGARDHAARDTAAWWHDYWGHVGLMRLSSADGSAQYLENIRAISLFTMAAERGSQRPGSQAGVADLFDTSQDSHSWDPASYWGWNLRMLVTAALGAGAFQDDDGYFALYRNALPTTVSWTAGQFPGTAGACVPETMRFNGVGIQVHQANGVWGAKPYLDCSSQGPSNFNARTLTTGAEVSLFIWQTYTATDDLGFLRQNYPLMADWARFILAYAKPGADGLLHTGPSNAHETQWDVNDPVTDITAMQTVLPLVRQAAGVLHRDQDLAAQIQTALPTIPPLPRTDAATHLQQLTPAADATGQDVIGFSYQQSAKLHNTENLDLEPVWPYGLIGDSGPLSDLAKRTFADRQFIGNNDWSFDAVDAARLGLASDVRSALISQTEKFQTRPSGLASFGPTYPEPYAEQAGVVATALQDALVQDYDGVLRIAPAWPAGWDADGTVYVRHRTKVDVQISNGAPTTVAVEAGADEQLRVRSPWPAAQVEVVTADRGHSRVVVPATAAAELSVPVRKGHDYLIEPVSAPTTAQPFAPVDGAPAAQYKVLGPVSIGLPPKTQAQTQP